MKNKNLVYALVGLVGLVMGFGGGFYFRNYQLQKTRSAFGTNNGNFQRFMGGNRIGGNGTVMMGRGGAVVGSVLSMDDKSVTVKLPDGSTKIVLFSDATTYANTVSATKSDLKTGETVAVAANSDGSVTASSIQVNPEFGRFAASPTPAAK